MNHTYLELADELPKYLKDTGFTHVEFLHFLRIRWASWGLGTGLFLPQIWQAEVLYVESIQQSGIGVILDWVPGHFPADEFAPWGLMEPAF